MQKEMCLTYVNGAWYTPDMTKVHLKGKCEVCGKAIDLKVFWKKYCGDKCRMKGWIVSKAKEINEEKSCKENPKA
jgi:predicted nucleic acid-binding Zn ribbon protein